MTSTALPVAMVRFTLTVGGAVLPLTRSVNLGRDAQTSDSRRPFGTLREQAALQREWLRKRLDTFLPALMRKHGIDMCVVPMREHAGDPVIDADGKIRWALRRQHKLFRIH